MNDLNKLYTLPVLMRREKIDSYLSDTRLSLNMFHTPDDSIGDSLIENFISYFHLPMGIVPDIKINNKTHNALLAVEETSIIAALNKAAKTFRESGSRVEVSNNKSYIIGQICYEKASLGDKCVLDHLNDIELILRESFGNYYIRSQDENIKILRRELPDFITYHVIIQSHDSMGANLVTQFCEIISSFLEENYSYPKALMNIVSNSLETVSVSAKIFLKVEDSLRDRIVLASKFAEQDRFRASTHNKGILNAIDPLVIVSGNDWRANNAAIHSWCAQENSYRPIATWSVSPDKEFLVGEINLPLQLGTVGGAVKVHPQVKSCFKLMNIDSKQELQSLIAVIGLLQNFAALRSLVTSGIVKGHMNLHISNIVKVLEIKNPKIEEELKILLEKQLREKKKVTQSDAKLLLNQLRG